MFLLKELKKKRTILSFVLGFILLALFLYCSDLREVLNKTKEVRLLHLMIAFFLHYLTYFLRGFRWKKIFCKWGIQASSWHLGRIILIFQFVDCIIPAKIGNLYGAHLIKVNHNLSRSVSLGSIVLWRFLDALVVVFLCGVSTLFLFGINIPSIMISLFQWWTLLILVAAALGLLFSYKSHWLSNHLPVRMRVLLEAIGDGAKPDIRTLPVLVASTVLIWLLEAGRFYFICQSMNLQTGIWAAIIITTASAMATAIPFTPSGLGAVEIFMVSVMSLLDFPGGPILYTIILLDRVVSFWSQIPIGLITMWISRYSGMRFLTQLEKMQPEISHRS